MMSYSEFFPPLYGFSWFGWPGIWALFLVLWSLFWKGWALWEAARNKDKAWFIVILVINTVGILEIAYLFFLSTNFYSNRERFKRFFSR